MALVLASGETLVSVSSYSPPQTVGTVCFWARPNGTPSGFRRILGINDGWECRTDGTGVFHDFWKSGSNTDGTTYTSGEWVHLAFTGRTSDGLGNTYKNGQLADTGSGHTTSAGSNTLTIGTRTGSSQYWAGDLDDLRIYNRVLEDAEIEGIHAARGADRVVDGLVLWLLFREAAPGTTVSGTGSVRDMQGNMDFSPGSSAPDYEESILNYRRRMRYAR